MAEAWEGIISYSKTTCFFACFLVFCLILVKKSSTYGAKYSQVKIIRQAVGDLFGVKASGGVNTFNDTIKMIEAGANRIGTSSGVKIIQGINDS